MSAVAIALVVTALVTIQVLIGGTRLLFSLPSYGLLGLAGVITLFSLRRARPAPDQLCLASTALFFGYIIARALLSPDEYLARADLYSAFGGLLVYFFVACILTGAKSRIFVLVVLFGLAMVHVIVGTIQFTESNNFMLIPLLQRFDYGRRASGFYVCPDHLAGLLEVLGIFAVGIVCWSRWPTWGKLLAGYAAGVCYLGVVLSGSRGGYLSTIVSCVVFCALSLIILLRASAKIFLRVGGALILAAVVIFAAVFFFVHQSYYLSTRANSILGEDLSDPSSELRVALWRGALQQWALHPVVGTGSGTYVYYGRLFRDDRIQEDPVFAHNDYVQMLGEYGLIAVAGFLLFLTIHLRRGWKTFQHLGPKRIAASVTPSFLSNGLALNMGALAAVFAYIVHSFVDFNLHIPANVLLLAFVFGLLANPGRQRGSDLPRPTASVILWRFALPVIGIIAAIQSVRLLPGEYFAERSRIALRDLFAADAVVFGIDGLGYERKNPNLYYYVGRSLALLGDTTKDPEMRDHYYEAAVVELQNARKLAPQDDTFVIQLAQVYDASGSWTEAEWTYQEALALDPKSKLLRSAYDAHLKRLPDRNSSR